MLNNFNETKEKFSCEQTIDRSILPLQRWLCPEPIGRNRCRRWWSSLERWRRPSVCLRKLDLVFHRSLNESFFEISTIEFVSFVSLTPTLMKLTVLRYVEENDVAELLQNFRLLLGSIVDFAKSFVGRHNFCRLGFLSKENSDIFLLEFVRQLKTSFDILLGLEFGWKLIESKNSFKVRMSIICRLICFSSFPFRYQWQSRSLLEVAKIHSHQILTFSLFSTLSQNQSSHFFRSDLFFWKSNFL